MADTASVTAVGAAIVATISAGGSVWAAKTTLAAQHAREREVGGEKWEDWKRGVYRRLLDAADGLSSIDATDPKGQERFDDLWADLRSAYNQLQLAAPDSVRNAAIAFREAWPKPGDWPPQTPTPWTDRKLVDPLVEAMRHDLFGKGSRKDTLADRDPTT